MADEEKEVAYWVDHPLYDPNLSNLIFNYYDLYFEPLGQAIGEHISSRGVRSSPVAGKDNFALYAIVIRMNVAAHNATGAVGIEKDRVPTTTRILPIGRYLVRPMRPSARNDETKWWNGISRQLHAINRSEWIRTVRTETKVWMTVALGNAFCRVPDEDGRSLHLYVRLDVEPWFVPYHRAQLDVSS